MSANPEPRRDARNSYYYRRSLNSRELLPALAIGVGVGLVAFYVARLFAQRTPLLDESSSERPRRRLRAAGDAG